MSLSIRTMPSRMQCILLNSQHENELSGTTFERWSGTLGLEKTGLYLMLGLMLVHSSKSREMQVGTRSAWNHLVGQYTRQSDTDYQ